MTEEKMIPLSVIDAKIQRLKGTTASTVGMFSQKQLIWSIIENLEELKKEAIPSPSGHWDSKCQCMCHQDHQGLEQKIQQRIKELESNIPMAGWGIERANELRLARIDELRKLLE